MKRETQRFQPNTPEPRIAGTKGAAKSPWRKGPMVKSDRAERVFKANRK